MTTPKTGFHQLTDRGFNPRMDDYETVSVRIRVWRKRDGWVWDYFGEGMKEANNGMDGYDPDVRYTSRDQALCAAIRLQSEHVFDPNGCGLLRARPEPTNEAEMACPACAEGYRVTRDGRHHAGFRSKRWFACRNYGRTPLPNEPHPGDRLIEAWERECP